MKPKIYVFVARQALNGECHMLAVAEDGEEIAWHISSNVSFGQFDMGLVGHSEQGPAIKKHDKYNAKYPEGYELEWVDDWRTNLVLSRLAENSKAEAEKIKPSR